jgi:DNA-binding NtrC family response regulator
MRLLIIGRLSGELVTASRIAISRGAAVTQADGIAQGLAVLRTRGTDLIMIDVALSVRDLVEALEAERIRTPVVACGTGTDARAAVAAIQAGAKEYIPLPPDPELIAAVIEAVAADNRSFVWRDPAMERVVRLAEQIARSEASVLITGESGTGKEVLARHVHALSGRKDKAFVSVNCAAIPDNLLESELFGHEKGSFTGAHTQKKGQFEVADKGTLFLDEIGDLNISMQAKLLRALQEKEVMRVGGTKPVRVDVRVIAATNRDLEAMVKEGTFREDLYYRLNIIPINIPPLRNRRTDLPPLIDYFIAKHSAAEHRVIRGLTPAARNLMMNYAWPGNVRQVESAIERAILLCEGDTIDVEDMPVEIRQEASGAGAFTFKLPPEGISFDEVEKSLITQAMEQTNWNITRAAKLLGLSFRTLQYRLEKFGLKKPTKGNDE